MHNFDTRNLIEEALKAGELLLEFQPSLNVSWTFSAILEFKLFEIAVTGSRNFTLARHYIKSALELDWDVQTTQ